MHFEKESDISIKHIKKITDSIKCYKNIIFDNIVIIISGDITQSGDSKQFQIAKEFINILTNLLSETFACICTVLIVPGNHDVNHKGHPLDLQMLKNERYSEIESSEGIKLKEYYDFSKNLKCSEGIVRYYEEKPVTINGLRIRFKLINNALFSTLDQYKGLLYMPEDCIDKLSKITDDIVICVMHHAPDFYQDDIKNKVEDRIIKSSDILLHGHEHYNYSKKTSYEDSDFTIVQSVGCLCEHGDWNKSSYIIGLLNVENLQYEYCRYKWNNMSKQYEHDEAKNAVFKKTKSLLHITKDFKEYINEDNNDKYYVFPSIIHYRNWSFGGEIIESMDVFIEEIKRHRYSVIVGSENTGKTTLLKCLFKHFVENHIVLYASPEKLIEKSSHKRQNIDKLIKSLFEDIYGKNESDWQMFEQYDPNNCVFIIDDFDRLSGINSNDFINTLSNRFGIIVITNSRVVDFDPMNINIEDKETATRFEICVPLGEKRKEIIRAVVYDKADDKSKRNIDSIVKQLDLAIKRQLNIIPPEPYYIVQMAENFMNNVGEAIYSSANNFSKIFEANLTNRIDVALNDKSHNRTISVDLMYILLGKIAYYIHFNKAYPIKRTEIEMIINDYCAEYGKSIITEDVIGIVIAAKLFAVAEENSEEYRFRNKSILAYFVAKEIILRQDMNGLSEIIEKACINICTDILLFMIYLTDNISIIKKIVESINQTIESNPTWTEFRIPDAIPLFLEGYKMISCDTKPISKDIEKTELENNSEKAEKSMVKDFEIKDIYDWDDSVVDEHENMLFKMTSLLQILAKSLPCFEHLLKKDDKKEIISLLYSLPNRIFMFWAYLVDKQYESIVEELKTHPYFMNSKLKMRESEIKNKVKSSMIVHSLNLLLNLYYIPVLNSTGRNTSEYFRNIDFFNYDANPTYQLEHLMFLEQIQDSDDFISYALSMKELINDDLSYFLLQRIVRHGLITRDDKRQNYERLESKFFPTKKKIMRIERIKDRMRKK